MKDNTSRIVSAFIIGAFIIIGSAIITDGILFEPEVIEVTGAPEVHPEGYLVTEGHIYRPDGSVCYTFADSLESSGMTLQFEEWSQHVSNQ